LATQASCRASCLNGGIKVWDRVEIPIRRGGWPYMRFVPGRMVQLARSGWGTDSFGGTVGLVGNPGLSAGELGSPVMCQPPHLDLCDVRAGGS